MGCGSSFLVLPSIISKKNKLDIPRDNPSHKSDKLPPIISQERTQKSIKQKRERLDNFEPFTLICLDDDFDENDQELRSIIDYVRCFNDLEQCEDFILNNQNKSDHLFFIVSNQYATNIISHIHDVTQIINIYILEQNTSNHKRKDLTDDRWTKRYSKVKYYSFSFEVNFI
jgi:hypothetical protein